MAEQGSQALRFAVGLQPADIAQLGERQTEDLKVAGSIPAVGMSTIFFNLFFFPLAPA